MKRLKLTLALLMPFAFAAAQCTLTPTVSPSSPVLCPNSTDTLWTQVYQTYQWYRGSTPIAGANGQYLVVDAANDAGYYFSVAVTQDTCSGTSPQVLVDSWVFLLPYVITDGDPGTVDFNGVQHNCPGDTVLLIAGMPYTVNLQWYDNGNPIPGATDDTLVVTASGNFTMSGAPAICPNFQQYLGVTIAISFSTPFSPVITLQGNTLSCNISNAASYQWYMNGNPISGATSQTYTPSVTSAYTVEVSDGYCSFISPVYSFTVGMSEYETGRLAVFPNPVSDFVTITGSEETMQGAELLIRDLQGRVVKRMPVNAAGGSFSFQLTDLEAGSYLAELLDQNGARAGSSTLVKVRD